MSQTVQVQQKRPRLTTLQRMKPMLEEWVVCPLCNKLGHLFGVNEEVREDGRVWRQYFLSCYDLVPFEDDSSRRGNTRPFIKKHHWVPSLKMLRRVDNVEHACNMSLYLSFETKQKDGRVTQRLMQRSDSYLTNFLLALQYNMNSTSAPATGTNLFGTLPNRTSTTVTATNAPASGNSALVIVAGIGGWAVGTGTTANAVDTPGTSSLATPILNGSAAGQLSYGTISIIPITISGTMTSFSFSSPFTNNSGASITITEVCMAGNANSTNTAVILLVRDVLATSITVNNTVTTTGTYSISITTS